MCFVSGILHISTRRALCKCHSSIAKIAVVIVVKVRLDTHTLLWATLAPSDLSAKVAGIIGDDSNVILVSAASAWEIASKVRLGRLPGAEKLEKEFLDVMEGTGYTLVPIDAALALRAGRFLAEHRDPF